MGKQLRTSDRKEGKNIEEENKDNSGRSSLWGHVVPRNP